MKSIFFLAFALLFWSSCGGGQRSSASKNFNKENIAAANEIRKALPDENGKPEYSARNNSEIRRIDFKNFAYPDGITVKDGRLDLSEKSTSKTPSRLEYAVKDIQYADLTGDAKEDALVDLTTFMGGGSSIYKHGFHLFSLEKGKAKLLWRLTTGSEADCGLKEVWTENKKLVLEVFGKCHAENTDLRSEDYETDVNTDSFTRFTFAWNGRKFVRENLEVLPFTENNIHNYQPKTRKN
ncbi:MAG TPA: hypothetical protein VF604_20790 [Pyrinomonadaceae bacterium]|jgi:hypothetical protein